MSAIMQDDGGLRGDDLRKAIESFIDAEYKRLVRYIDSQVRNTADAEDIAQEACLGFATAVARSPWYLASPIRARRLLYKIACRRIIDRIRRMKHLKPLEVDLPDDGGLSPETSAMIQETIARLMDVLNDRERYVFRAIYWDGETEEDIAIRLGITPAGVRKILQRAREKILGKMFADTGPRLEKVLDDQERDVLRACCWDGPSDAVIAAQIGDTPEGVRQIRKRAIEKVRDEVDEVVSDREIRVVLATYWSGASDQAIAEGLGITAKDVQRIRRIAIEKLFGEFGH